MKSAIITLTPPALLVLAAILAYAMVPTALMPVYPEGSGRTQDAHVLAASLMKANEENSTRFRLEYAGDAVRAKGKVRKIHENGLVEMKSRWGYTLYCEFEDRTGAASLNPGDRVILNGAAREARRTGETTGEASLESCTRAERE